MMVVMVFYLMMKLMVTGIGHFETYGTVFLFSGFDFWCGLLGVGQSKRGVSTEVTLV